MILQKHCVRIAEKFKFPAYKFTSARYFECLVDVSILSEREMGSCESRIEHSSFGSGLIDTSIVARSLVRASALEPQKRLVQSKCQMPNRKIS